DCDLGRRRYRQPRPLTLDYVDRSAAKAARVIEFRYAVRHGLAGGKPRKRLLAERDRHRTGFSLGPVFLPHDAGVMSRRYVEAEAVAVVDLHAIDADVDPRIVGIGGDDADGGADIAAAVE